MADTGKDPQTFYYPNKLGRIILLSLEEVIGRNGINAVLNLADLQHLINNLPPDTFDLGFRFDDLGSIHQALDTMYGPRAGRGLALRAGRACFKHGLHEFGSILGVSDLAFRLLPLKMKIKVSVEAFADLFNNYSDQVVWVEEKPDEFFWHTERCPACWGRVTDSPCCQLTVGLLQETLFWVSGGKYFMVEETSCIAQGDQTCTIHLSRQPLE
jgi:predicted hydrocarbon binding protein